MNQPYPRRSFLETLALVILTALALTTLLAMLGIDVPGLLPVSRTVYTAQPAAVQQQPEQPAVIVQPPATQPEPLPALPEYAPWTVEEHAACLAIARDGRLEELPQPQRRICAGYVGVAP